MSTRNAIGLPRPEGVIICTSTTHPANPYVGMRIFETDTGNELTYQSATTGFTPPWNTSWGLVPSGIVLPTNPNSASTTVTDVTGGSVTFTAIASRYYEVQFGHVSIISTVNGDIGELDLADGSNTTLLGVRALANTSSQSNGSGVYATGSLSAGSFTYKLRVSRRSGTGTVTWGGCFLSVKDAGPSAAPV